MSFTGTGELEDISPVVALTTLIGLKSAGFSRTLSLRYYRYVVDTMDFKRGG